LDLEKIQETLEAFAQERDWNQYHSPKNLAMALSVEVAELLEHFQWLTQEESANLNESSLEAIRAEIADIQIYLLRLADKLKIDIASAVEAKIEENNKKYPAERVKGSSAKYTDYK
jgi:NTP pyrophosphatase (non-canonical NTP hydrolase)